MQTLFRVLNLILTPYCREGDVPGPVPSPESDKSGLTVRYLRKPPCSRCRWPATAGCSASAMS